MRFRPFGHTDPSRSRSASLDELQLMCTAVSRVNPCRGPCLAWGMRSLVRCRFALYCCTIRNGIGSQLVRRQLPAMGYATT